MKMLANVFITAVTTVAMLTSTCPTAAIAAEILPSSEGVATASAGVSSAEQATASSTEADDSDADSTAGAGATTGEDSAAPSSETSNDAEPANTSSEATTGSKATADSAVNAAATDANAGDSTNDAATEDSTAAASSADAADESTLATVELNAEDDFTVETWNDGIDAATADGDEVSDTAQSVLAKVLDAYESCDSCIEYKKADGITVADVRSAMALAFASAEYYWASTSYNLSYYDADKDKNADDEEIAAGVYFKYYFDATEVPAVKTATEAKIAEALSWIDEDEMSDFEVAQALHDYIVRTCVYDLTAETSTGPTISHSAYGALTKGTAVCQGYALAYKLLLSRAGVPCVFVISDNNNMNHAWDMVQVEGNWYHVDVTWDDPVYSDGTDAGFDVDVSHTYFLRADSTMKNSLNHYGWEAAYTTPSNDYSNRTYAEYKAPVSTTGSGSGESSGGNEPSEASTDGHVYAHSDTATQGSITLTVQWDDPVLGEPTTFHVSATGGTGSYKYYMAAPMYSSPDENSYQSVADPSRTNYWHYTESECESYDYTFTMTATGTYYINFYVMDTGVTPNTTLRTNTLVTVSDDNHPSVSSIVSGAVAQARANTDGSDYAMALYLHDWLLDQLEYDSSLKWSGAEAALTRHTGTCQAYTNAYIKLLDAAGITNSETRDTYDGHTWNAVKLDGEWYQVDCTWDDNDDTKYYGFDARHLYFGLTDELMAMAHKGHAKIYTADGYGTRSTNLTDNHYVRSGLAAEWADAYAARIQAKLDAKTTTFSISSDNAYNPPSIIGIQNAIVAYAMSQRTWTTSDGVAVTLTASSDVTTESSTKWTAVYNFEASYSDATVTKTSLAGAKVSAPAQTYTGSALKPAVTVTLNGTTLKQDTDYTVAYSNNTNAGTANVTITGKGNYTGTATGAFTIKAADASKAKVTAQNQTYSGSALKPAATVTLDNKTLSAGKDYDITYTNNVNAGTATVTITGKGNYTGTAKGTFTIKAADASKAKVTAQNQTYSGSALKPAVTVTLSNKTLSSGKDYDITYTNNVNAGTATVTAKFKGNYSGTAKGTFKISALNASKATVKAASQTYTSKALTPAPTVTFNGKTLKQGTDYTASYANNVNPGTATVTVTFKGNYTGSAKGTFAISGTGSSQRLSGATRYDTMASIVSAGFSSSKTVIIASGENFPDALGASSPAGAYGAPVILTSKGGLSDKARSEVSRLGATKAYIVGGQAAVSASVESSLRGMGLSVERVAGNTRQETATKIAAKTAAVTKPATVIIAAGNSYPDALSVSPYAYAKGYPIYLAEGDGTLSASTLSAIKSLGTVKRVVIVGGTAAIKSSAESQLRGITANIERWSGATRYETSLKIAEKTTADGMSWSTVAVASGENFPDALAGASLIGKNCGVLLLTSPGNGSAITGTLGSKRSSIGRCYILGGEAAVDKAVENQVNAAIK